MTSMSAVKTAALCPLHRIEDLNNLQRMIAHQTERVDHVLLFLNGEAQAIPDQPWAETFRGCARSVSAARNELLEIARNLGVDWGFFLDADDYYSPHWFELCKERAETLGVSAFGLNAGWTSYDGRLIRFTEHKSTIPLGGTLAVRVGDACAFEGDVGEEIRWTLQMRDAGRQVAVLNDTQGYCYVRRTGKGTAWFTWASIRRVRGVAEDFGHLHPSWIDLKLPLVGVLPLPSLEEAAFSEAFPA